MVKVPMKSENNTTELCDIEVLDPLSVISYLFNEIGLCIPPEHVRQYWSHYRSEEISAKWAMQHPASNDHIPLGLYGDACKIRAGEKMIGIFLNLPLFRPQSIRCSRFLLVAVQEEHTCGRQTLDALYRYIVWRLNLAFDGKFPVTNIDGGPLLPRDSARAGQPIAQGKQFALTEIRGDWVWFKDSFGFRSSWKGGSRYPVCFKCEARVIEPYLYYKVKPDSSVWGTEYDNLADFIINQMPRNPRVLVKCVCRCRSYSCEFTCVISHA